MSITRCVSCLLISAIAIIPASSDRIIAGDRSITDIGSIGTRIARIERPERAIEISRRTCGDRIGRDRIADRRSPGERIAGGIGSIA